MKKSDLKDGMIVELNYGKMGIILNNSIRYNVGFDRLNIFDDNLRFEDVTIDRIYEVTNDCCSIKEVLNKENLTLMWKRPREIDWSKVPKWTKVRAKHSIDSHWVNAYFIKDTNNGFYTVTFSDEFTYRECLNSTQWCEVKIHPSVEILKEWYKE